MINTTYHPAPIGAGFYTHNVASRDPEMLRDGFERLPMNLSSDEIREMVLELLG